MRVYRHRLKIVLLAAVLAISTLGLAGSAEASASACGHGTGSVSVFCLELEGRGLYVDAAYSYFTGAGCCSDLAFYYRMHLWIYAPSGILSEKQTTAWTRKTTYWRYDWWWWTRSFAHNTKICSRIERKAEYNLSGGWKAGLECAIVHR